MVNNALYDLLKLFDKKLNLIHNNLPNFIKKYAYVFSGGTKFLLKKVRAMSLKKFNNFYFLEGEGKNSNGELKVLFIDFDLYAINYFAKLFFSDKSKTKKMEKKVTCNLKKIIKDYSNDVDIIFVKKDKVYSKLLENHGFIIIPRLISMSLDVSHTQDYLYSNFSRNIRKTINKILRSDYYFEISDYPNKLDFFYYKMYLPFAEDKFGDEAIIIDYKCVKKIFERGKLLFVKEKGNDILGVLMSYYRKNKVMLALTGVAKDYYGHMDKNISLASTYFSINWSKNNNIKILNFGFCRPYLNDGIFQHNRKWGTYIEKFRNYTLNVNHDQIFGFKILNFNDRVKNFLEKNPFINLNKQHLNGMVFLNNDVTCDVIHNIYKRYNVPGLNKIYLCFMKDIPVDVKNLINTQYRTKLIILDEKTFKEKYCQINNC